MIRLVNLWLDKSHDYIKEIPYIHPDESRQEIDEKISIVTACGNKKQEIPLPAWQLYASPRIKAVYNGREKVNKTRKHKEKL